MAETHLEKPFSVRSYLFVPAGTGSEKRHRLKVRLRFTGKDPGDVLKFCTEVSGEPVRVRFKGLGQKGGDVDAVGRLEHAGCTLFKGDKIPPVNLSLVFEGDDVDPIDTVLRAGTSAARGERLEVDLELDLVQEYLPGIGRGEKDEDRLEDGKREQSGELPIGDRDPAPRKGRGRKKSHTLAAVKS